ncbi:MAG: hypothetical protein QNL90_11235 [Gammaproteobacteria bacterium]|nr:hypothetical protein [Gammaproteobacteria bacterium]MDX2460677.1 hypothetical protein [Gammaproteobacteria bacterium]
MSATWRQPSRFVRSTALVCGLVAILMLPGCTVGPALYKTSFTQYNDAVRQTLDEQMLANLVRIRYFQSPIFLQVSSLNTSFAVGGNASLSGTAVSGGADSLGATVGGSYEERPTISFSMVESREYYGRLLAPLSADQITSLVLGGFDSELVFMTSVRGVNGLQNLNADFDDSSEEPLAHAQFKEVLELIKKLRSKGIVDLELGGKQTSWSSPVTVDATGDISQVLMLGAASYAMSNDAEIVSYPDGKWQTHRFEKHMALRFSPASDNSPDAQRLKKLLGLAPDRYNFPIVEAELVNAEKARGVLGQSPGALDPSVVWTEIGLRGRSMLEIMQVASKEVRVPEEDVERGTAAPSRSRDPQSATDTADWFVIKSSDSAPPDNSLSIKYRGHWFYIDDTDLQSRETFAMLTALFAVIGGTVPGAHPVLTLPVAR